MTYFERAEANIEEARQEYWDLREQRDHTKWWRFIRRWRLQTRIYKADDAVRKAKYEFNRLYI